MAKRDAPKQSESKGKTKAERHSAVTRAHKAVRVARQERLAARGDDRVSENCRKAREKRDRAKAFKRNFKGAKAAERKTMISPSEAGQRQFGEKAKGHHLHQREHGLAVALTPAEFQKEEQRIKALNKPSEIQLVEVD